jgi:hypothetical protein
MTKIETNTVKPEVSFIEDEINHLIINANYEISLDTKIQEIDNYMRENSGKNKSDKEKDELYKNAQELWRNFIIELRDTKYNFHLNREQFKFITDLIISKLEYDVNTVFFAIELTNLMGSMKSLKFTNDKDLIIVPVDATEITYIYHLISKHKIKGLTRDAYTFANILKRIGSISKIFNYYDNTGKDLSKDIQDWVSTFDNNVTIEGRIENSEEVIEAKVSKSKKKEEV